MTQLWLKSMQVCGSYSQMLTCFHNNNRQQTTYKSDSYVSFLLQLATQKPQLSTKCKVIGPIHSHVVVNQKWLTFSSHTPIHKDIHPSMQTEANLFDSPSPNSFSYSVGTKRVPRKKGKQFLGIKTKIQDLPVALPLGPQPGAWWGSWTPC